MIAAFEEMGVNVNQAWGMTEMSPIGTRGILPSRLNDAPSTSASTPRSARAAAFSVSNSSSRTTRAISSRTMAKAPESSSCAAAP